MTSARETIGMDERILVPIDGSPLSYRALRHAIEKFPEGDIVVLHVSDLFEPWHGDESGPIHEPQIGSDEWYAMEREATEEILSEARNLASEYDSAITTESGIGDPQRLIPDYVREEDIDHVVVGAHGREEEGRSLFGRVAETVVYRSPASVTIIR